MPREARRGNPSFEVVTLAALPRVEPLVRAYYSEAGEVFSARQQRAFAQLAASDALGRAWLITSADSDVGYVAVTLGFAIQQGGRDAFVDEIYVAPGWRGRGFGRAALAHAETFLRDAGVGTVHLAIKPALPRARALYERHGFIDHGWRMMSKELA